MQNLPNGLPRNSSILLCSRLSPRIRRSEWPKYGSKHWMKGAALTTNIGPYDAEGPVLAQMHDQFIADHRYRLTGRHHEVYFSDPRRTSPEKLRTFLCQPLTAAT